MNSSAGQQSGRRLLPRWPWRVVRPRPLPTARTVGLSLLLLALSALLVPSATAHGLVAGGPRLVWWQLAAMFAASAVFVFHVEINGEAHTFSLSEVPLVLALFFASPAQMLTGRLIGEAVVLLLVERQGPSKVVFNLSLFSAESLTALSIFHGLARGEPLDVWAWSAALAAVATGSLLTAAAVWTVIRVHGGRVSPRQLLVAAAVTVVGNTSLATIAVVLLQVDPLALLPLVVVAVVMVGAYRGYNRLSQRYEGLTMLYEFTRITGGAQRPDQTMQRVLAEAGSLLRARRAMIALFAPGSATPWLVLETVTEVGSGTPRTHRWEPDQALPPQLGTQALRDGDVLLAPRTSPLPAHRELLAALGAKDCLAAPLSHGGETSGVLVVCDRLGDVSTFDAEDGRLFATLASQAAIALENGRLIDRLHEQARAREHEALHDALTGLPNRSLFGQRLAEALQQAPQGPGAVLLMDLDGFKEVNDTLGHHVGDELLQEVGRRLLATISDRGVVARLGGDEFVVVLPALPDPDGGSAVAAELIEAIMRPMTLASMTLQVGASIGVASWPVHGLEASALLQRADVAMYTAKRTRAGVSTYDSDADWNSQVRLRLAGELRAALADHQIDVWYQPIARATDCHVVGAEALVRWMHPELGRLNPSEFIPIAERNGLIHELTLSVLDEALAQVRAWQDDGLDMFVTVNLPPQVLRDVDWRSKVAERLAQHHVDPRWLTFEITETGIMTDPERMIGVLGELAESGISFAIDDFGTGYSSLSHLQQLPVSKVKIDKSFVTPMASDPGAAAIVRSVIELARSLGHVVIAEGVEDARTLDHLIAVDCQYVQGYYLSRPIPAVELTAWMSRRRTALQPVPG